MEIPQRFISEVKITHEADSLFKWFHARTITRNQNCIVAVVGGTGTGKSYTCLRIAEKQAELLNRQFDIRNCCRNVSEFMNRITSGELKRGDVIILEEVGVNVSAREWQTKMNKLINYVFQTFRTSNLVVLLNLPDIRMLDINSQRVLHAKIETQRIDFENKKTIFKFKVRKHKPHSAKDYWLFLKVIVKHHIRKIRSMSLNKPSDWICETYEKRRKEFTDKLNAEVEQFFMTEDAKRMGDLVDKTLKKWTPKMFELQTAYYEMKEKLKREPKIIEIAEKAGIGKGICSQRAAAMTKIYPLWRKIPRKQHF